MKTKADFILTVFIVMTLCLIGLTMLSSDSGLSFSGKAQNANIEFIQKRILERSLSNKEAEFYEKVK
jgi:preprotein translocase subunit SecG